MRRTSLAEHPPLVARSDAAHHRRLREGVHLLRRGGAQRRVHAAQVVHAVGAHRRAEGHLEARWADGVAAGGRFRHVGTVCVCVCGGGR